jgi:hypothetical protein
VAVLKARSAQDEEEDDDSPAVIPWTLSQARAASEWMKTAEHPELCKYVAAVEGIEKLLENMTFSARSKQTTLLQYDFTAEPAAAQTVPDSKRAEYSKSGLPDGGVYYLGRGTVIIVFVFHISILLKAINFFCMQTCKYN